MSLNSFCAGSLQRRRRHRDGWHPDRAHPRCFAHRHYSGVRCGRSTYEKTRRRRSVQLPRAASSQPGAMQAPLSSTSAPDALSNRALQLSQVQGKRSSQMHSTPVFPSRSNPSGRWKMTRSTYGLRTSVMTPTWRYSRRGMCLLTTHHFPGYQVINLPAHHLPLFNLPTHHLQLTTYR